MASRTLAASSAVGASESPATHVTKFSLGHRLPPGLEARRTGIFPPTSAQGSAAGGALACRRPSTTPRSLLLLALRDAHVTIQEGLALRGFQLVPPIICKELLEPRACGHYSSERASEGSLAKKVSSTTASLHSGFFSSCFPFCNCSKTHEPRRPRARQWKWTKR